ncbi:MAG: cytochrome c peroxidase [Sulfurovum sp.]|nr:cytochrome c peroxidase [Sulfurovum sp.]
MRYSHYFLVLFVVLPSILVATELVPMPLKVIYDDAKAQLGKKLFADPILSKNKKISCLSCHDLSSNGADTVAYSIGIHGRKARFNTPTIYNATYNFRQFWDGRSRNLKEQALDPIENPNEMGNSIKQVLLDLKANAEYVKRFKHLYDEGISKDSLSDALSEFGKALTTPNSDFDYYLQGDKSAISTQAIEGYRLFQERGCISCHNGINIGGNLYNKFGIYEESQSKELGRYEITQKVEDKFVFKVPSLRNVSLTAPYMHDGSVTSLEDAVNMMSKYQLGRPMKDEELHAIVAFLQTLVGERPSIVKDMNASH